MTSPPNPALPPTMDTNPPGCSKTSLPPPPCFPDWLTVEEPSPQGLQSPERNGDCASSLDASEALGEQPIQGNSPFRVTSRHGKHPAVHGALSGQHVFRSLGSKLEQEKAHPVKVEDLRALELAGVTGGLGRISFRNGNHLIQGYGDMESVVCHPRTLEAPETTFPGLLVRPSVQFSRPPCR